MKEKRTINGRKGLIAAVALVLLLCAAVGGTLAWLTTQTDPVVNTFTAAHVTCQVDEDFDQGIKKNVKIENTSDIDAYIRAAIVVCWADANGNVSAKPVTDDDYTMNLNLNSSGWVKGNDGYYYYTRPVSPDDPNNFTSVLINSCAPGENKAPDGYNLQVTILAEAIQSTPADAVTTAWASGVSGITGTTLTIKQ